MADISVIKLPNGNSYNLKDTTARSMANSAVPNTRTVNGKALSSDISLGAGDVGAYTKSETDTKINAAVASTYKYKGSVTADKLPTSGQVVGDVYNITNDSSYGKAGMNVAWNGTTWDALGSNVDLSNYVTTSDSRLSNARPANGGNASTVNGHTVNADVPAGAKFTDTTYSAATQSANGLMSAADKKAIDREFFRMVPKGGTYIPENADLNSIEYIKVGNYYNTFDRESTTIKNIPVIQSPYKAFMMYVLSPLLEVYDNESTDQWVYRLRIFVTYTGDDIFVQKVDSGATAGRFNYGPWVKMTNSNDLGAVRKIINDHIANKSNPHGVTKAQVGLGSVANLDQSKAIKSITRSGTTFTATALDGTTTTFTQQDSNTTYSVATSSADGLMSAADKSKLDGVADQASQLAKNTAQIETAGTATSAHSVGEYVMISNALYKVTASVAKGDTWTIGTNVTAANIGSEIGSLKSDIIALNSSLARHSTIICLTGSIFNEKTGPGIATGTATVVLNGGMALIFFDAQITTLPSNAKIWAFGINIDHLRSMNPSIPAITPLNGGVINYIKSDGTIQQYLRGYGGCFQANNNDPATANFLPARIYTTNGDIGGWDGASLQDVSRMSGVAIGTY